MRHCIVMKRSLDEQLFCIRQYDQKELFTKICKCVLRVFYMPSESKPETSKPWVQIYMGRDTYRLYSHGNE